MSTRCYTTTEVIAILKIPRRTFYRLKAIGQIPFLEELRPRIGRRRRYRAEPVDRYLENRWRGPRRIA
jgi:excisionase family DNA binding protein